MNRIHRHKQVYMDVLETRPEWDRTHESISEHMTMRHKVGKKGDRELSDNYTGKERIG